MAIPQLRSTLRGTFLLASFAIAACESAQPAEFVAPSPEFKSFQGRPASVSRVLFGSEVLALSTNRLRFEKNVYCGTIQFSGGYVRGPAEQGGRIQNRVLVLSQEQETMREAVLGLAQLLTKAFANRGLREAQTETSILRPLLTLESEIDYQTRPDEGRDSINLPVLRYRGSAALSANARTALRRSFGHDGYLVVPLVLRYYRHNAGWFNGQEIGSYAGARIAVKILIYDLRSGARVFDEDYEQKRLAFGRSILNTNEYFRMFEEIRQDILLMLEKSLPSP